ncbi:MAG: TolC family protein [Clostridium sp.]|nr:TolC family protein [Clostridium sp.]
MNHRRQLAAALACAMAVGLCAGHVFADGTADPVEIVDTPEIISPADPAPESTESPEAEVSEEAAGADAPLSQPAGTAALSSRKAFIVEGEPISPDIPLSERQDPEGTVSFENLEARMRENNLNILALDENIESIEAIDLKAMHGSLTQAIWMLESQQKKLEQLVDGVSATVSGLEGLLDEQSIALFEASLIAYPQATIASLQTQIDTCRDTIEQIKDGSMEEEYDAVISQLMNAQDQIVMGGQTLYLALLGLEQTQQGLLRNQNALDRTLAELDIRYEMGQISALSLAEANSGRTALISGMETLSMNMTALRRQLEAMLGEEITGTITLQPLTAVTAEQLSAVDYNTDLKKVKRYSYDLEAANKAWHDAESDYHDLKASNTAAGYEVDSAHYAAKAADLSKQATEQSIELTFANLCDQIRDQQQVLSAAKTTLTVKQDSYAAAQLKYEQGTISYNVLMDAQDALDEAADTVDTAAIDLFTYYNNYCWAVEHGILN